MKVETYIYLFLIFLLSQGFVVNGQTFKYGGSMTIGTGGMWNNSIKDYYEQLKSNDPNITSKEVNFKPGIVFGLGADFQYYFDYVFSVSSKYDLLFNYSFHFQNQINSIYFFEHRLTDSLGSYQETESDVTLNITTFNIPLSIQLRYNKPYLKPYIRIGGLIENRIMKKFSAEEKITSWDNNVNKFTNDSRFFFDNRMQGLSTKAFALSFGTGFDVELSNRITLAFGLNLYQTIGKYELWTVRLIDNNGNNDPGNISIFEYREQQFIENNYEITLNDWNNTLLLFTFTLYFEQTPYE
ncbi:hypothetical protein JYT51_01785 [Candidatus Amoebophilus asiaticus]|nr:hypothetical protein [Candidatus Amoebophilus asiaticus]